MSVGVVTPRRNRQAVAAAMEPRFRELIGRMSPLRQAVMGGGVVFGAKPVGQGKSFEFDVTEYCGRQQRTVMRGFIDPPQPGKYCAGRVHISAWKRGAWEMEFDPYLKSFDPWFNDLLPGSLISDLRLAYKSPMDQRIDAKGRAVNTLIEIAGSVIGELLNCAIYGKEAASAAATFCDLVPGPHLLLATAIAFFGVRVRPSLVKLVYDAALKKVVAQLERDRAALIAQNPNRRWRNTVNAQAEAVVDRMLAKILGRCGESQALLEYMSEPEATVEAAYRVEEALQKCSSINALRLVGLAEGVALCLEQMGIQFPTDDEVGPVS